MTDEGLDRRRFLGAIGAGAATLGADVADAAEPAPIAASPAADPVAPAGYQFLNPDEAAFMEAFVDHLIPADALSPSGTELGVAVYADRQLAGAWGKGARMYLQGPWRKGTPNQGWQSPMAPADLVKAGIAALDAHCRRVAKLPFERLAPDAREETVAALAQGKIELDGVPSKLLFDTLYALATEGLFADPIYGGNRDKAGWRLVGFPGVIATHAQDIETYRGRRYEAEPMSIADMS
ncbi:gluconate 2-dehydrogenase gamma chain [Methylopila capsulata]|uniref:Gluconate 2-dehydrogenase gamma chain n=1 Tax=Methylopila capsulata TaxID=61654 RepID=A0A9W6IWZ2_9HYPH|nr:gluconate 2-dehydrogenase subunit 3 family protein [Methylopila capsulata]MBM7852422.1 gluconate 2-dehydrogenase gamma chain [Methylopila capsulata]GLK56631.1 hypothetical protein GCM10008170_26500 [Methylopila capsulata]